MNVKIDNLGVIDHAEMDVGNLTVICGENNTGKTYVTYALYGFLRSWRRILAIILENEIKSFLRKESERRLDLVDMFKGKINEYLNKISEEYSTGLPHIFASRPELFEKAKFSINVNGEQDFLVSEYQKTLRDSKQEKVLATITKTKGQPHLELVLSDSRLRDSPLGITDFISDAIADILFSSLLPEVFIASAERTGAAIFHKELDFLRTRLIEMIGSGDSKELRNPFRLLRKLEPGYAWPVRDNVDFVRQLQDIEKESGVLNKNAPQVLNKFEEIVGGNYKVVKGKGLYYFPSSGGSPRLTLIESSSSVRALVDIGFYLRAKANVGDLLMIDEPELNLHPVNQRKLARLIVELVNQGIKVFITTHSDYIVKEFNTLIMLHKRTSQTKAVQEKNNYNDSELLNPQDVRLYMTCTMTEKRTGMGRRAKLNTLKQASIHDDQGIEASTFDTTINEMNKIQTEILFGEE